MTSKIQYLEEASLNAVFLVQKKIVQLQSRTLNELLLENQSSPIEIANAVKIPGILSRRHFQDDSITQEKYLDSEEATILGMLDGTGKVSLGSRLTELIVLMTRITRVRYKINQIFNLFINNLEMCRIIYLLSTD